MKIFSKFRDFYDSCLSFGIDENIVFMRNQSVIKQEKITGKWSINEFYRIEDNLFSSTQGYFDINEAFMLHFCGKEIPFLKIRINKEYHSEEQINFCYNIKQVESLVLKYCNEKCIENFYAKHKIWKSKKLKDSKYEKINNWFISNTRNVKTFDKYFEYETPYYLETSSVIIINPCLTDISFYKYYSSFEAFQEISMFISGVMGGQVPPMVSIDDKVRFEKKGFDSKRSFRKMERK